jgi:hypothetical protein
LTFGHFSRVFLVDLFFLDVTLRFYVGIFIFAHIYCEESGKIPEDKYDPAPPQATAYQVVSNHLPTCHISSHILDISHISFLPVSSIVLCPVGR